jgi:KDO2-lipid IV(A) lauroyltransferase
VQRVKDYLVYLVVRCFICIVQAMSLEQCQSVARFLAWLANDVFKVRRDVTDENLRHVFPDWTGQQRIDCTRKMWEHLFLMVCEVAHVPRKIHDTNWRRFIHVHRKREMVSHLLDTRPSVVVSGHFGNFELANHTAGLLGIATFAVARPIDNPFINRYINRFRGSKGCYMIDKIGSANLIETVLQSGGKLALLGDQNAGIKGCWVDFMGRPASCHKAIAIFTLTGGAPMIVSYARRTGKPLEFEVGVQDIVDPKTLDPSLYGVKPLTQWYNQALEKVVRQAPEQYWWIHRRWKKQVEWRPSILRKREAKKAAAIAERPAA